LGLGQLLGWVWPDAWAWGNCTELCPCLVLLLALSESRKLCPMNQTRTTMSGYCIQASSSYLTAWHGMASFIHSFIHCNISIVLLDSLFASPVGMSNSHFRSPPARSRSPPARSRSPPARSKSRSRSRSRSRSKSYSRSPSKGKSPARSPARAGSRRLVHLTSCHEHFCFMQ
jgi:hypothetical protein